MSNSPLPVESVQPAYVALASAIQQQLLNGEYPVDSRLPVEKELAQTFGVSVMTVRQGIGLLVRKGLVVRKQGKGTFVRKMFQGHVHFAVLFGPSLVQETRHSYRALLRRIEESTISRKWSLRYYDGLNPRISPEDRVAVTQAMMLADHGNAPFEGLIEISPPTESITPSELALLPKVIHSYRSRDIQIDNVDFIQQTIRELARRGYRRICYIPIQWRGEPVDPGIEAIKREAAALGLSEPEIIPQVLEETSNERERTIFQRFQVTFKELDNRPEATRPDAYIFLDDIALNTVLPIFYAHRLIHKRELGIASLANKDFLFYSPLPVVRYVLSPSEISEMLLDLFQKRILGIPPSKEPLLIRGSITLSHP